MWRWYGHDRSPFPRASSGLEAMTRVVASAVFEAWTPGEMLGPPVVSTN
jgi:hypothetical protein